MITQSQWTPDVHCMPRVRLTNVLCIVVANITAEKHVTPFDGDVYLDHIFYNIIYLFLNKEP
jgi:hypothetical protein